MRYLLLILILLALSGCADKDAYTDYLTVHQTSTKEYFEAVKAAPLVDIILPSPIPGQPYKIVVNQEVKSMNPDQIKDSEWTGVAGAAVGIMGGVAGQYVSQYYDYKKTGQYMSAMGKGMTVNTGGGNFSGTDMMKSTDMATTIGGDGMITVDQSKTEMPPEEDPDENIVDNDE